VLSHQEARRAYDRIGSLQDSQAFYEDRATDVLAFPIDGGGDTTGPRELGDVVICPARATDVREAAVHGVLHLCGFDHEADAGEMLALQHRILGSLP